MIIAGKVCVVTGAARGIGLAICKQWLAAGGQVVMGDADEQALAAEADNLAARYPNRVFGLAVDVRVEAQVSELATITENQFGSLDVWINNAGLAKHRLITDYSEEEIDTMLDVNFKGTVLGCKYAMRSMQQRKSGHIINIISTAGLKGVPTESVYCGTKFAVRGFTEALQSEAGPWGIRVSGVYPGGVHTAFWDTARDQQSPVEDYLKPEDVANAVLSVIQMDDNCVTHGIVIRSMRDENFKLDKLNKS